MSRRLRFQVKPNINPSTPQFSTSEEPKSTSSAPPVVAETKITETPIPSTAVVDTPTPLTSPSPRPPSVVNLLPAAEANIRETIISVPAAPPPIEIAGNETTQIGADVSTNLTDENVSGEITNLEIGESQATMPPPGPQHPGKRFDWRTMRKQFKGKKLDRSSFLMRDLIFWSPEDDDQPAEDGDETHSVASESRDVKKRIQKRYSNSIHFEIPIAQKKEKLENAQSNAPQVKVNADGSITIDETSLVVDRREQGTAADFETVDETSGFRASGSQRGPRLTSMTYRKNRIPGRGRPWSKFETDKFYRVLSFAGLDFTLVHELFPTRSRLEIKRKYKRECIDDPARLDRALMSKVDRHGPWGDLKKMIIERGRITDDERSRALLDSAKDLIEEEDERIELEIGRRKPSVETATQIAKRLSKHGFGINPSEDDVTPEQLERMAEKIVQDMEKKNAAAAARLQKKQEAAARRQKKSESQSLKKSLKKEAKSESISRQSSPQL